MTNIEANIAFLGTGLMGKPMADRLVKAGHKLKVWNRSAERMRSLQAMGALPSASAAEAVEGVKYVILMLDTAATTHKVLFESGVAEAITRGALVIDMSSNDPETARECAGRLASLGIDHLDAPVSGGTNGAESGTLAIMVGGSKEQFLRADPVFSPIGRSTYVGASGAGQLAKLANQIIVAVTIGAVSEALLLAREGGADPMAVRSALTGGFADSRILQLHGERMLKGWFEPGGTVTNQIKDLDAAEHVAQSEGLTLPLLETVRSAFTELADQGDGDRDHSALFLWLERLNEKRRQGKSSI